MYNEYLGNGPPAEGGEGNPEGGAAEPQPDGIKA